MLTRLELRILVLESHLSSLKAGWWSDDPCKYEIGTKIALIHSEIDEASEAFYANELDEHLTERSGLAAELADVVIRVCDLAGALNEPIWDYVYLQLPDFTYSNSIAFDSATNQLHRYASRLLEAYRRGSPSERFNTGNRVVEELYHILKLCFDIDEISGFDLKEVIQEKMAYNSQRDDHKTEVRAAAGGKKF